MFYLCFTEHYTMNAITFKPVVLHYQRGVESYNVKIRLTFKRKVRYLPTTVTIYADDLTRSGKFRPCNALAKSQELIKELTEVVAKISPFKLDEWNVDDVIAFIRKEQAGEGFALPFCSWCRTFLSTNGKLPQTNAVYYAAVQHFEDCCGDVDINAITAAMLRQFVEHCNGIGKTVAATALPRLGNLYDRAKDKYNDEDNGVIRIPKDPFGRVKAGRMEIEGKKPLSVADIQKLIDYTTDDEHRRLAVDACLISLALMGANLADIWAAEPPVDGVWTYRRVKTASRRADGAEMHVMVESIISPAIMRQEAESGPYWLGFRKRWPDKQTFIHFVLRNLSYVAAELGIELMTTYSFRKAWATQARRLGVEKALVDECLGHVGDFRLVDIYAERNWQAMWAANRKVLQQFSWEGLGTDRRTKGNLQD